MTPSSTPDAVPSAAPEGPRLYRVGTLTYTRGALIQVMFWMLGGDFFFQLMVSLNPALVPLQLRWAGASDSLIGLLGTSLSSALGFLWFPVVSTYSDRFRGRLGRRRPFLLWCTPPVVLSLVLMGAAKPAGGLVYRVIAALGLGSHLTVAGCTIAWIALCLAVFLLFNAFIVQAFACLIVDVIPQEAIGKFTGLYRAVGALGNLAFNRWIFGWAEANVLHVYCLVGLLFAGAFYLLVWQVKEGGYPPPPPKAAGGRLGTLKGYLVDSFGHRFYLKMYLVTFFYWASLAPLSFVVFFGTQAGQPDYAATLGLSLQEFGQVKGWTFVIQIPVFVIVGYFVDRFHPIRVSLLGLLLTSVSYFCCFWFIHGSSSLLFWWSLNQAVIAIWLGAGLALGPRLLPRDRYGQFVSANYIFGISSLIIFPPLVGLLLETLRDYRYLFIFCGVLTLGAFAAGLLLFRQWKQLGGDRNYAPPQPWLVNPAPAPPPPP